MNDLKALYIIVNAGFASEVVDIARSLGSTGATIINARGSVAKPKTILGITIDTEKEIVLSVVKKEVAIRIMQKIKEKAGVGTPAHGLCFFLPVEMSTLTIHEQKIDEQCSHKPLFDLKNLTLKKLKIFLGKLGVAS